MEKYNSEVPTVLHVPLLYSTYLTAGHILLLHLCCSPCVVCACSGIHECPHHTDHFWTWIGLQTICEVTNCAQRPRLFRYSSSSENEHLQPWTWNSLMVLDSAHTVHTHRSTQWSSDTQLEEKHPIQRGTSVVEMEPQVPVCKSPHIRAPSLLLLLPLPSLAMWTCLHIQNRTQTLEGRKRNAGAATVETFVKVVQHNPSSQHILCTLTDKGAPNVTGLELRAEIRGFRRLVFDSEPPRFYAFLFTRKAATETFGDISLRIYIFLLLSNTFHFLICLNISTTAAFKPLTVSYQI